MDREILFEFLDNVDKVRNTPKLSEECIKLHIEALIEIIICECENALDDAFCNGLEVING